MKLAVEFYTGGYFYGYMRTQQLLEQGESIYFFDGEEERKAADVGVPHVGH